MTKKPQTASTATWFEVGLPTHTERVDLVTGALAELGVLGTEVRDTSPAAAEVVFYIEAESARVADTLVRSLLAGRAELAGADFVVREAAPREVWTENWRSHFAPVEIGRRLAIVPPWDSAARPGRTTLVINPGGAFGTGRHETTWLCLELVEELVRPGMHVADVGAGSGILGIAAAMLGARSVLAVDFDPAAIDATRENAATNGVADRIVAVEAALPPLGDARYDLVVANIYSDTLLAISERLTEIMAPRAKLVLSGIEAARSSELDAAFARRGLRLEEKRVRGDWAALVFGRASA